MCNDEEARQLLLPGFIFPANLVGNAHEQLSNQQVHPSLSLDQARWEARMLTSCANPGCVERFKYLGEGRLYLDNRTDALELTQQQLYERCCWLCPQCAGHYDIRFQLGRPVLVPKAVKKAANG